MTQTTLFAALGALLVSVVAGCGGNVTIDKSGDGGAGGSTTTPSTTVTDPKSYCESLCGTFQQYGCLDGDVPACIQGCEQLFSDYPECNPELKGLYDCFAGQLSATGCNLGPDACQGQTNAATECINGSTTTCGTDACSASGNNDCSCSGSCNGYYLEVDCKGTPGAVECNCLVDGEYAATCKDSDLTCDLYGGCCANYFPL